jgi:hypothetical protein
LVQKKHNFTGGQVLGVANDTLRNASPAVASGLCDTIIGICVQDDGATDGTANLGKHSEDGPGVYV